MFAKGKITIVLSVMLLFIGFTSKVMAQNPPAVTIGNIDPANHSTIAAITAQTGLQTATAGYFVSEYTLSLVSDDQNATVLISPVTVNGADLTQQIINDLNSHANQHTKLLLTGLRVMGGGMVMDGTAVTYTLDQ
ncbi:MAG: hypothetical protein BGO69_06915 [Bacteroidetes bacterium 46-16]|nr:MAG: hypothetical protein BGO69_06915 [Bacteroidetes bacterium 46-16]